MKMKATIALLAGAVLLLAHAAWWLLPEQASFGPLENIHGIPYPAGNNGVLITEKLAHADVYLKRSPFFRTAALTVTFTPLAEQQLAAGIRENAFWLSYPKQELHEQSLQKHELLTRTITIPLTDKLPDRDGSLDLMFFALGSTSEPSEAAGDRTRWVLHDVRLATRPALPSPAELKDALRSLLTREQVQ